MIAHNRHAVAKRAAGRCACLRELGSGRNNAPMTDSPESSEASTTIRPPASAVADVPALSLIVPLGPTEPLPSELLGSLASLSGFAEGLVAATEPLQHDLPLGWRATVSTAGRGRQQNAAAAAASGRWLLFLHADSRIDGGACRALRHFVDSAPDAIGYAWLRFASDGPRQTCLNAIGANLRSRWLGLPYGDQALCLPAAWFLRLGGFREDLSRGEDLDLVVRARLLGLRTRPLNFTIETSARRYRERGWLRTSWAHQRAALRLIRDARRNRAYSR